MLPLFEHEIPDWFSASAIGAALLASYLLGSIPCGYLLARLVAGIDIRHYGSGNIGATNVARVLGKRYFLPVFVLDFCKGAGPVAVVQCQRFQELVPHTWRPWLAPVTGLAAMAGHLWPIWLGFRGGKGVATGAGVVSVLVPWPAAAALIAWLIVATATRVVALASLAAALVLAVTHTLMIWPDWVAPPALPLTLFVWIGFALVLVRHRDNLRRLLDGTGH